MLMNSLNYRESSTPEQFKPATYFEIKNISKKYNNNF